MRRFSNEGAVSLPFRLGISMAVLMMSLPLCMQALGSASLETARAAAASISGKLVQAIGEISYRPVGEARTIPCASEAGRLGDGTWLVISEERGGDGMVRIESRDSTGWVVSDTVKLCSDVGGISFGEARELEIDNEAKAIRISKSEIDSRSVLDVSVL